MDSWLKPGWNGDLRVPLPVADSPSEQGDQSCSHKSPSSPDDNQLPQQQMSPDSEHYPVSRANMQANRHREPSPHPPPPAFHFILTSSSLHPHFILTSSSLHPHFILTSSSLHPHFILTFTLTFILVPIIIIIFASYLFSSRCVTKLLLLLLLLAPLQQPVKHPHCPFVLTDHVLDILSGGHDVVVVKKLLPPRFELPNHVYSAIQTRYDPPPPDLSDSSSTNYIIKVLQPLQPPVQVVQIVQQSCLPRECRRVAGHATPYIA
ncbi:uncharacterized protein LY79DRAFT_584199 [Colletotrichum navitas]|uniref:Uncharacterized protein n=1 Tax=Colletotrichum navitas TaxID=681940 RepID=A0AAD8UZT0_9PEZI|nr:uncharacterized protein LY79DRAFT_584199 [Colletotrichum navitas]KAK1570213.1 hypothetical protein LY79DRAFT_584199 [Colletotrichum navitas]